MADQIDMFALCLKDREWRLSFHEFVMFGFREPTMAPGTGVEREALLQKTAILEKLQTIINSEKGAKAGLLKWARKDRTDESRSKIGWATESKEHKQHIIKLLKSL
jgi:hypothetical protein